PPVATDDTYNLPAESTLTGSAPGLLANDVDPDGLPLTAQLVSGPAHGSFVLNADGSFSYTPDPGFRGTDSIPYQASDGTRTGNVATLWLTVQNNAPTAVDDSFTTDEDTWLIVAAPGLLGNDTDPDGDSLTVVIVSQPTLGLLW